MNDYKVIIKELNIEFNECDKLIGRKIHLNLSDALPKKYEILAEDCCGEMVSIMQTISCAADAIEQLLKERDAAVRDIGWNCTKCKNYDEKSPNYGYTEKCETCGVYPWCDDEAEIKWEWKGVRDE